MILEDLALFVNILKNLSSYEGAFETASETGAKSRKLLVGF